MRYGWLLLAGALAVLGGCAEDAVRNSTTLQESGVTSIDRTLVVGKDGGRDVALGPEWRIRMGKEYQSLSFTASFDGQGRPAGVTFDARGVSAATVTAVVAAASVEIERALVARDVAITAELSQTISKTLADVLGAYLSAPPSAR